jgi:hypothetical protein
MSIQRRLPLQSLTTAHNVRSVLPRTLHQLLDDSKLPRRNNRSHHRLLLEGRTDASGDGGAFGGEGGEESSKDGALHEDAGTYNEESKSASFVDAGSGEKTNRRRRFDRKR